MLNIEKLKEIKDKSAIGVLWKTLYDRREGLFAEAEQQIKGEKKEAYYHTLTEAQILTGIMKSLQDSLELPEGQNIQADVPGGLDV